MATAAQRKAAERKAAAAAKRAARGNAPKLDAGEPYTLYFRGGLKSQISGGVIAAGWGYYQRHVARIVDADGREVFKGE
ncbi:MAG: hypothetical protein A4C66_10750 [Nitrospira sp. HN-bin3]|uniref:hypothetical protein n=1 Tax=Nitrospira cf. moscoviensis SBR1015 TaxID=96242 RepID=UPI000A0B5294|nr:hypothetical protein [Nitrospira cf. moscoviensis SBR1015]OQW40305.1 MAG: hypothetical protein A4C66_10750 [Nitrospira sp. HN-bin3]